MEWLQGEDWCGPISTRAEEGTLKHADLCWDHPRTPDIGLVLKSHDSKNEYGMVGYTLQNSDYPVNGGLHGGLHPIELNNWLAVGGNAFKIKYVSSLPAGIVDVFPTTLTLLGLSVPAYIQGRTLTEALLQDGEFDPPASTQKEIVVDGVKGYRAHLQTSRVGNTAYLDSGWVTRRTV